jgi:hypothetical protein
MLRLVAVCNDVRGSRAGVIQKDRAGRYGVTSGPDCHIAG